MQLFVYAADQRASCKRDVCKHIHTLKCSGAASASRDRHVVVLKETVAFKSASDFFFLFVVT